MGTIISTTTSTGITLSSTSSNPVTVTGTITTSAGIALYGQRGSGGSNTWTITNSGRIASTANHGLELARQNGYFAGGVITNLAGGYILGTGNAIAYGVGVF